MKTIKLGVISVILISSLCFANNETSSEDNLQKAYMLGAFHSLEQLTRNFKVQGMNKDKIEFNKFIVALDIQNMPTYKLMVYQQIGYSEALTPVVVNDKYLVFGSYERKADAIYLQEKVLNSFHFKSKDEKAVIIENSNPNSWFKSQFVQKELFDTLIAEANKNVKAKVFVVTETNEDLEKKLNLLDENNKKEGIVSKIEPIKTESKSYKTPIVDMGSRKYGKKAVEETTPNTIKFKLKYKTQIFSYNGDWKGDVILDKNLNPSHFAKTLVSQDFHYATSKKTKNGLEFVKFYDSNSWVNKNDIEIIN